MNAPCPLQPRRNPLGSVWNVSQVAAKAATAGADRTSIFEHMKKWTRNSSKLFTVASSYGLYKSLTAANKVCGFNRERTRKNSVLQYSVISTQQQAYTYQYKLPDLRLTATELKRIY